MNDPQFVEAARILAEKMTEEQTPEEAIELAFLSLLSRQPRLEEKENLTELWKELLADFINQQSSSDQVLSIGSAIYDHTNDPDSLAAYAMVASAIMNYDEFVVKR